MTTLTDEQVGDVRRDYRAYTSKHALTDAEVARELDISSSVLSQFRSGSYKGDNDKIARLLNDFMERHARKQKSKLPKSMVLTTVAQEIMTIVGWACLDGSMAAIVAPSGCGKTMVLEYLAEKYRGHYLYCTEDLSPGAFLFEIPRLAGVTVKAGKRRHDLTNLIVERLRGTNRPLFLDEAHRLPKEVIPRIRTINDRTKCPIIMAGAAEILHTINDRSDGRGQFSGRCLEYNVLDHCTNVEDPTDPSGTKMGRPLFSREEVRKFLDTLQVKFDGPGFDLAYAIACLPNHSSLRTVRRIVLLLRPDQAQRSRPIERKEVVKALGLLFGVKGTAIGRSANRYLEVERQQVA